MSYSQENGYIPTTIDAMMVAIMDNINTQWEDQLETPYTIETFEGTNFYKYFYALAQELQENEVKTSEIFLKLQQYFDITNELISRPVVTSPGIVEKLETEGYIASLKPMIEADAGKQHVCIDADDGDHATAEVLITDFAKLVSGTDDTVTVAGQAFVAQTGAAVAGTGTFQAATSNADTAASLALQINSHATVSLTVRATAVGTLVLLRAVHGGTAGNAITLTYTEADGNAGATVSGAVFSGGTENAEYADIKTAICELLSTIIVGGTVTVGSESEAVVISNGQSFDYKYNLPNRLENLLRLTITLSENNQVVVGNPDDTKLLLIQNIEARYRLGRNFEPQRYFSVVDAPWAASVLLEYSLDGGDTYSSDIYEADYDDLFNIELENVELVEE